MTGNDAGSIERWMITQFTCGVLVSVKTSRVVFNQAVRNRIV